MRRLSLSPWIYSPLLKYHISHLLTGIVVNEIGIIYYHEQDSSEKLFLQDAVTIKLVLWIAGN